MPRRPRIYPVHHTPGRTRLRIATRGHDRRFFEAISTRLRRLPGVSGVEANPETGSVLIQHSGPVDHLLQAALGSDVAELVEFMLNAPPLADRLRDEAASVDASIRKRTQNELDLPTVAALGLMAVAGILLLRGRAATPSISLVWYASELMRRWPELQAAQATPLVRPGQ